MCILGSTSACVQSADGKLQNAATFNAVFHSHRQEWAGSALLSEQEKCLGLVMTECKVL